MKLELKHLAAYLPYGLKVLHNISPTQQTLIGIHFEQFKQGLYCLQLKNKKMLTPMSAMKPILRPMTDLSKEELRAQGFNSHIDFLTHEKCSPIGFMGEYSWKSGAPYEMVEYLFSQHFDVFGLIPAGLAIDINKLTTPS